MEKIVRLFSLFAIALTAVLEHRLFHSGDAPTRLLPDPGPRSAAPRIWARAAVAVQQAPAGASVNATRRQVEAAEQGGALDARSSTSQLPFGLLASISVLDYRVAAPARPLPQRCYTQGRRKMRVRPQRAQHVSKIRLRLNLGPRVLPP
ncbi:hypothetical protein GGTG_03306 [Gaeumannomyces tritici R3-111a-1]|uniref:Uncharacterized protein n=1 Tax=Gaeumannomyces tritici (strain R3-111a-1) TaxID=644352 RepID=J3NPU9_GAET3|nr:hypothetical protein GGTG_03306 [Gaeumannomyces tritici R3-111a-1]EJT78204.1 hypothetical protein GGTG_03306 [Gaeumannomyces tritici R3-111a-1]